MSANDELRDELTKRGVEWEDMSARFPTGMLWCTSWTSKDGELCTALEGADDIPDGKLSVQALLTPAQAIAATLGSGTVEKAAERIEVLSGFAREYLHRYGMLMSMAGEDETDEVLAMESVINEVCGRKVVEE